MIRKYTIFNQRDPEDDSPYSPNRVIAVADAATLLKPTPRKALIKKIKQLCRAPERYYKALYEPLIEKFTVYVQSLPDIHTIDDKHHAIEWLDSALSRAAYAVSLRHRMIFPQGASIEQAEIEYPLWTYVLFSSALLWQIGKLSSHFTIDICNQQGMVTKEWNPMVEPLYNKAKFFKIRDYESNGPDSYMHLTPVLARHIMPDEGFRWIAANEQALSQWLAALVDEEGATGSVVSTLTLAQMILVNHPSLKALLAKLKLDSLVLDELIQDLKEIETLEHALRRDPKLPPVSISKPPETEMGEAFYEWLKNGLRNGTIPANSPNAHVHITKEGVILAFPEIFQDYVREFHRYKDWILVYKQFNALGITKMSGGDTWFGKFFVEKNVVPSPLDVQLRGLTNQNKNRYGTGRSLSSKEVITATSGPVQPQNTKKQNQSKQNQMQQSEKRQQNIQKQQRMAQPQKKTVKGMLVKDTKRIYGSQKPELSTIIEQAIAPEKVKQQYPDFLLKTRGPKNTVK